MVVRSADLLNATSQLSAPMYSKIQNKFRITAILTNVRPLVGGEESSASPNGNMLRMGSAELAGAIDQSLMIANKKRAIRMKFRDLSQLCMQS